MQRIASTYFNPKSGFEVTGAAIYSVNWENPATDYETGNILNLEGAITQNFGALGVGAVGYAMSVFAKFPKGEVAMPEKA